jgi:hypothetical protein
MRRGDRVNAARRAVEERVDQAWTLAWRRVSPPAGAPPYDGHPRLAVVTVNRSTTRWLKLMLCTLFEQVDLDLVLHRLVIVDNASRDGGGAFADRLAAAMTHAHAVHNRRFLNHARGIRSGLSALERLEGSPDVPPTNLVLFVDPDVVFRNPETLVNLVSVLTVNDGAFAGELRRSPREYPDVQASFLLVRRDWLARKDVRPWVNHGSPSVWLQESIWEAGGVVVDFPSNLGGYILHRGRGAVAAAREFAPRSSYATASAAPSYMGVRDGARIWAEVEQRWDSWLDPASEPALIEHLAARFSSR